MKKTPDIRKQYEDLAPCDNDRCLARQSAIEAQGYKYIIVRSVEEFINEIENYFKL